MAQMKSRSATTSAAIIWGQGLATEAACACRDFGFARLPVDRFISIIRPENLPSRRVAEKNGMTVWKEVMRVGFPHVVYSIRKDRTQTAIREPVSIHTKSRSFKVQSIFDPLHAQGSFAL